MVVWSQVANTTYIDAVRLGSNHRVSRIWLSSQQRYLDADGNRLLIQYKHGDQVLLIMSVFAYVAVPSYRLDT